MVEGEPGQVSRSMDGAGAAGAVAAVDSRPSLRNNALWQLGGNSAYVASQALMLAVLGRLAGAEAVGIFSLGLAVTAPVVLAAQLSLRHIQASDATDEYPFRALLRLRCSGAAFGLSLCVLIAFEGYARNVALVIALIALAKSIESLSDLCYGQFEKVEEMRPLGSSLVVRSIISPTALTIGLLLRDGDLIAAVMGLIAAWTLLLLFHDLPMALRHSKMTSRSLPWRQLIATVLPLAPTAALVSLQANVPKYVIERVLSAAHLGLFATAAAVVAGISVAQNSLSRAATPRLARHYRDGSRQEFARTLRSVAALAVGAGVAFLAIGAAAGRAGLALLFGPDFVEAFPVLIGLLLVGPILALSSVLSFTLIAIGQYQVRLYVTIAGVAACGLLSIWLVPRLGLMGAVLALGLSTLIKVLGEAMMLRSALTPPSSNALCRAEP